MRSICNLQYSIPKQISIIFHHECNYDYYFIIKELVEESEEQFTCLEDNTEKYIKASVPTQKDPTRTDKNREETTKATSYRYEVDSARFLPAPGLA